MGRSLSYKYLGSWYFLLFFTGRSFCDWSSCQEGCTKTVYTCWKIIVEYQLPGVNPGETVKPPTATGKLFPNVKVHQYILALIHSKQFIEFLAPDLNVKNLKFGICSKEKRFAILVRFIGIT